MIKKSSTTKEKKITKTPESDENNNDENNNDEIVSLFNTYADKLLNNSVLKIKDQTYRICEIEMYYHDKTHPDEYTHKDILQMEFGKFYMHRFKNKTYKSGTYKCIDIAYGDKKQKTYFGILIRSIKNIKTGEFFTGPCISVNEMLKQFDCKEFKEFTDQYDVNKEFILTKKKLDHEDIYIGPRVGLGDKYPEYKNKNYRYATHIKQIKKQKIFEKLNI